MFRYYRQLKTSGYVQNKIKSVTYFPRKMRTHYNYYSGLVFHWISMAVPFLRKHSVSVAKNFFIHVNKVRFINISGGSYCLHSYTKILTSWQKNGSWEIRIVRQKGRGYEEGVRQMTFVPEVAWLTPKYCSINLNEIRSSPTRIPASDWLTYLWRQPDFQNGSSSSSAMT